MVHAAQAEIDQNITRAREELRGQVVSLAVAGAGKVLKKEIFLRVFLQGVLSAVFVLLEEEVQEEVQT